VLEDLDGRIDAVLDAGPTEHGVESTVLDPCQSPMVIYRPGAVTSVQIRDTAGVVNLFREDGALEARPRAALPSPGVGLRHYAPRARLVLLESEAAEATLAASEAAELGARLAQAVFRQAGERVGVMLPAGVAAPAGSEVYDWGRWTAPEELAQRLYAGLRALDGEGCTVILCLLPRAGGIGAAIRDRLRKAANLKTGDEETES
jgi:L-threonylcarbamoyladenylate synthase